MDSNLKVNYSTSRSHEIHYCCSGHGLMNYLHKESNCSRDLMIIRLTERMQQCAKYEDITVLTSNLIRKWSVNSDFNLLIFLGKTEIYIDKLDKSGDRPGNCSLNSSMFLSEYSLSMFVSSAVSWLHKSGGFRSFWLNFVFGSAIFSLAKIHEGSSCFRLLMV